MTASMIKILVELDSNEWHGMTAERLWASEIEGGHYRIENNPMYAYGISFADIVDVEFDAQDQIVFDKVIRKSGHSNYRILLRKGIGRSEFESVWPNLESLGCRYESTQDPDRVYAIDVPPDVDVHYVYSVLLLGEKRGLWYLDEGNFEHAQIH